MLFTFKRLSQSHFFQTRIQISFFSVFLYLTGVFFASLTYAAANYNTGAFYFANGEYMTAMSIWAPLAEQGHPAAQYSMGLLYDQGKGVEKDSQRALEYFQSAVQQNLPAAQYYLGVKYFAGLGVKKDLKKARQLLFLAAEQDHLQAQFQLGHIYNTGAMGIADPERANFWFGKAAESGHGPAQHTLASHYLTGRGVSLDLEKGIFWLRKAADQNDADAMRDLGFLYFQGMGVKQDYRKAHDFLLLPAEEGSPMAQFILGEIYANGGDGIKQNWSEAKKWYQLAQSSGNKEARQRLKTLGGKTKKRQSAGRKAVQKTASAEQTSASGLADDAARFQQLDDNFYTLQILQARHYESISRLTDQYTDKQTYFFRIHKNDEPLFVLLYGGFATYSEAKKMVATLPAPFQLPSPPWVRQVQKIKTLIK